MSRWLYKKGRGWENRRIAGGGGEATAGRVGTVGRWVRDWQWGRQEVPSSEGRAGGRWWTVGGRRGGAATATGAGGGGDGGGVQLGEEDAKKMLDRYWAGRYFLINCPEGKHEPRNLSYPLKNRN
jgi:hypothetical protein